MMPLQLLKSRYPLTLSKHKAVWEELKAIEREAYGDKSFFWLQKNSQTAPIADGSDESYLGFDEEEVVLTSDTEEE